MKKNAFLMIAVFVALMSNVLAQETFSVYNPESDALMQIKEATEKASVQKK